MTLLEQGPLIADSFPDTEPIQPLLQKFGKKLANQMMQSYNPGAALGTTFEPILRLRCDFPLYKEVGDAGLVKPHAFCMKKSTWKKAKWHTGNDMTSWKHLQTQCSRRSGTSSQEPPPNGCTGLSCSRSVSLSRRPVFYQVASGLLRRFALLHRVCFRTRLSAQSTSDIVRGIAGSMCLASTSSTRAKSSMF